MSIILDSGDMDALTSERSEKPPPSYPNHPDSFMEGGVWGGEGALE